MSSLLANSRLGFKLGLVAIIACTSISSAAAGNSEKVIAKSLSDGKDNGGNLSFDEVLRQVKNIQEQLKLEIYLARTRLSLGSNSNDLESAAASLDELDAVVESFGNEESTPDGSIVSSGAKIIPTTKKLFVYLEPEDTFPGDVRALENVEVPVDAINNEHRNDIQINIYAWAVLSWCKRAQLVLHEHMGITGAEKSLSYNKSAPLAKLTSFCEKE